jgi:hypothetical protein
LLPELIAFLDQTDPLYNEILDARGALSEESQIAIVLPRPPGGKPRSDFSFHVFTSS